LHGDRDENIKFKAYIVEFEQSEYVHFNKNETFNEHILIKRYGPNVT